MKTAFFSRVGIVTALAIIVFLFSPAEAATLLVTNNNDSGAGSLRQAILDNESLGGGNTIIFSNVTGVIALTSSELLISSNVTIFGPGPRLLAINGNATNRVFHITPGNTVSICGLGITNGGVIGLGGGIDNELSRLVVSNCAISGNQPTGIYNHNAVLSIIASTISGNAVTNGNGGGINNDGSSGGGSTLSISTSTISSNSAIGSGTVGGGIFNDGNFGGVTLSLSNCTFSGNSATQTGGGIYHTGVSGNAISVLTVIACTVNGNSAGIDAGGILNQGASAETFIGNTILKAGNSGANLENSGESISSLGYNLSSDNGAGFLKNASDQTNKDPELSPLADNGGPTPTCALVFGSPAVDKGKSFGLTTDQRGAPRSFKFTATTNAPGGDGSDIGAFELGGPQLNIQQAGTNVLLSWPSNYTGFTLQSSTNIARSNNWGSAGGSAGVVGNQYQQTNGPISGDLFFRLREN